MSVPAKSCCPSIVGVCARSSCPTAVITARAGSSVVVPLRSRARTVHVAVVVVPGRLGDLGLPQHMAADVVLVHHALEIRLQFGLFGEEVRPLIGRLEAVAVEVVGHVDPRAGVGVLVPGAADARVLLDDRERDAGLLEPDPRQQSRLTASDDDDGEVVGLPR